jgi:16S rRNA (adenine1518-N6/adenine1519-N6)-dimethyltransferase
VSKIHLTRAFLECGARHVTAIKRDARCIAALGAAYPGRLTVNEGDALALDQAALTAAPRKIVADLPYNIAMPLLIAWLRRLDAYDSLTLLLLKEVAQHLTSRTRSCDHGRLTIVTQWLATVRARCSTSRAAPSCRHPRTSTLVQLVPRAAKLGEYRFADLEHVTAAAFGQRRKMPRPSLRPLGNAGALAAPAGVTRTARAEELAVEHFCALARALGANGGPSGPVL